MRTSFTALLILLTAPVAVPQDPPAWTPEQLEFFESRIRPVLVAQCYECHSTDARIIQGGFRLDDRSGLLKGGDTGPAVVPGNPEAGTLLDALRHNGLEMPPKGRLADKIIHDFETWIAMGAPDPRVAGTTPEDHAIDIDAGRKHWAFHPMTDPPPPQITDESWPLNAIDQFLLARLEAAGLSPAADTDRYTWLRRVSFDLTGLPPTVSELESFLADESPLAFETVVDRLLGSRAFGERWTRHWLDLTGYADQIGTSNSVFAEHAWRYRDYLIDAFNSDKPYDRFVREQIAGDLLQADTPEDRAAAIVATGFLLVGDVEIVNPDKLRMETDHIDLQVSKIGTVFMGMTLGCARCHDHKFDPIGLEDYYGIAGILRSTSSTHKIPNGIWSGLNTTELPETPQQAADREQRQAEYRQQQEARKAEQTRLQQEQARIDTELAKPDADKEQLQRSRGEIAGKLGALAAEIEHAEFFAPAVAKAYAVHDVEQPSDMAITIRGNPYAAGPVVPRGMMRVACLSTVPAIPDGTSGRRQLAEWLTDGQHPLTARVAVNRIWQKMFGQGLVRSVDYFGTRGETPSHPELLDHLATQFMRNGWSRKHLIRSIALSRAYRMSSTAESQGSLSDPDNRLLWRMNRHRLDAEAIRDAMLAVSGELVSCTGGPGMPLEFPENTGSLSPTAVNPPSFAFRKFRPEQEFQRTVYLPVVRSAQPSLSRIRDVFDFVQPAQIAGVRPETVVATQALFLLNNELPRNRAAALAVAIRNSSEDQVTRLENLWMRALNRPITEPERNEARVFLDAIATRKSGPDPAAADTAAWTELCHTIITSNEFLNRL